MENPTQDKVKLFVNKDLVIPGLGHIELLYPFFRVLANKSDPYSEKIHKYIFDKNYFELVSDVSQADYYLIPHDYWQLKRKSPETLEKMLDEAKAQEKKVLIDASGDVSGSIDVPNSVILRLNQYRFDLPANEITVPFACEDLLESYCGNNLPVKSKSEIPTVGFAGWAGMPLKQRVKTIIKEIPIRALGIFDTNFKTHKRGVFWREKIIKILKRSTLIKGNFIIRASYSGHIRTLQGDPQKNRQEFVKNLIDSDYSLVVRGDANAAVRFYETLSLGRIPVFLDTACVLPLEDKIDYKEFCLFIDFRDVKKAPKIISDFHAQISNEKFIAMQEKARYIFRNFLRRDAFSKHLALALKQKLK